MKAHEIKTGQRFGMLVVLGPGEKRGRRILISCQCDCGRRTNTHRASLVHGVTRSCGCLRGSPVATGHCANGGRSPTYVSWFHMLQRCSNPRHRNWLNYGARGIAVCKRWRVFANFLSDMGERPSGTSLDRINNDGHYEPGNCRWATAMEQRRNQRPVSRERRLRKDHPDRIAAKVTR